MKGKSQLTETDPEMTYMIDSLDRDIKSYYNTILYVPEDGEGLNVVNGGTKIFYKDSNQISRAKIML